MMVTIEQSIDLALPAERAYERWTRFEEFPAFMAGVESVERVDERHLEWTAAFGGPERTWTAVLTEENPDRAIAWSSISGPAHSGVVDIEPLGDGACRVTLRLDFEAEDPGAGERARGDLERFGRLAAGGGAPAPAEPPPAVPGAQELVGLPAFDRDGVEIGTVAGVHLAPDSPRARHLSIAIGAFGGRLHLVPAEGAAYTELWNGVTLPFGAEELRASPAMAGDAAPTPEDERAAAEHFGTA
jgi:ribosome-associated toxin RatA of RatAB toxin-antitoxin module